MKFRYTPIAAILLAQLLSGCGESSSSTEGPEFSGGTDTPEPPPVTEFDEAQLIENAVDNIILPAHQAFNSAVQDHLTAVDTYCQALSTDENADDSAAQSSWHTLAASWQLIEVMQLSPLLQDDSSLRNQIYSWPNVFSCGVDQDVVYFEQGNINGSPYDITKRSVSRRGIDALEYLQFNENLNHSCADSVVILADWNARTEHERRQARCQFAVEVAEDISTSSQTLNSAWSGTNGFAAQLKNAGQPGSEFTTTHEAVNLISDALFYLDSITKDEKLAEPLGLDGSGADETEVESVYAKQSYQHILVNLNGIMQLFSGDTTTSQGVGFEEYLVDLGDTDTATLMRSNLEQAQNQISAINTNLADEIVNGNTQNGETAHQNVKAITDQLKTDFITSLSLELPDTAAGDND